MPELAPHPSLQHVVSGLGLVAILCLSNGCLTTLDLSEQFPEPDTSTLPSPDMRPGPDMPADEDMPGDTPRDMKKDVPEDIDAPPDMRPRPDMPIMEDMPIDLPPDMPAALPGEGLIISELVEGAGNDKAVEIYNTSSLTLPLDGIYLMLLSHTMNDINDGIELALDSGGATMLAPGEVLVVCHDSITQKDACDILETGFTRVINFNGDDRVGIFHDSDGSGNTSTGSRAITPTDRLIDSFGHIKDAAPDSRIWEDATFRRCNFTPYQSNMIFDVTTYYTELPASLGDLGVAPVMGPCM